MALDATPVCDLEQAVWWLVKNLTTEELQLIAAGAQQLPRCAKIVCDIFWVTEQQLCKYIKKKYAEIKQ